MAGWVGLAPNKPPRADGWEAPNNPVVGVVAGAAEEVEPKRPPLGAGVVVEAGAAEPNVEAAGALAPNNPPDGAAVVLVPNKPPLGAGVELAPNKPPDGAAAGAAAGAAVVLAPNKPPDGAAVALAPNNPPDGAAVVVADPNGLSAGLPNKPPVRPNPPAAGAGLAVGVDAFCPKAGAAVVRLPKAEGAADWPNALVAWPAGAAPLDDPNDGAVPLPNKPPAGLLAPNPGFAEVEVDPKALVGAADPNGVGAAAALPNTEVPPAALVPVAGAVLLLDPKRPVLLLFAVFAPNAELVFPDGVVLVCPNRDVPDPKAGVAPEPN